MRAGLRRGLTAAMKAHDRVAVSALRSALAAIANAEALPPDDEHPASGAATSQHFAGAVAGLGAAEVERRHLSELEVRAVVESEIRERRVTAVRLEQTGHVEEAEVLRAQAHVLEAHLEQTPS